MTKGSEIRPDRLPKEARNALLGEEVRKNIIGDGPGVRDSFEVVPVLKGLDLQIGSGDLGRIDFGRGVDLFKGLEPYDVVEALNSQMENGEITENEFIGKIIAAFSLFGPESDRLSFLSNVIYSVAVCFAPTSGFLRLFHFVAMTTAGIVERSPDLYTLEGLRKGLNKVDLYNFLAIYLGKAVTALEKDMAREPSSLTPEVREKFADIYAVMARYGYSYYAMKTPERPRPYPTLVAATSAIARYEYLGLKEKADGLKKFIDAFMDTFYLGIEPVSIDSADRSSSTDYQNSGHYGFLGRFESRSEKAEALFGLWDIIAGVLDKKRISKMFPDSSAQDMLQLFRGLSPEGIIRIIENGLAAYEGDQDRQLEFLSSFSWRILHKYQREDDAGKRDMLGLSQEGFNKLMLFIASRLANMHKNGVETDWYNVFRGYIRYAFDFESRYGLSEDVTDMLLYAQIIGMKDHARFHQIVYPSMITSLLLIIKRYDKLGLTEKAAIARKELDTVINEYFERYNERIEEGKELDWAVLKDPGGVFNQHEPNYIYAASIRRKAADILRSKGEGEEALKLSQQADQLMATYERLFE